MKISAVYYYELKCAHEYGKQSCNGNNSEIARHQFFEMSWQSKKMADHLAHCIILFGDIGINDADFSTLKKLSESALYNCCASDNPWTIGMEYLESVAAQGTLPAIMNEPPQFDGAWPPILSPG